DVTLPILNSIEVDKNDVTIGDTVTISVDAEDSESGIKNLYAYYFMPITKKWESVRLSYHDTAQKYVGEMDITEGTESGLWEIIYVYIEDYAGNELYQYNSNTTTINENAIDLSTANFKVSGTTADVTVPILNSIEVDKNDVTIGDIVTISVDAEDSESGIKNLYAYYFMPITKKWESVRLSYHDTAQKYVGE